MCCRLNLDLRVSILSQPEGRELLENIKHDTILLTVSILSQPEGRELRVKFKLSTPYLWFQSSPSPKAGSY